jgi:hypothetical protein
MGTKAYPALAQAQSLFKNLVWDNIVNSVLASLFVAAPWMKVWPIGPIVTALVKKLTDKVYAGISLFIDLQAIVLVNQAARAEYEREVTRLRIIAIDHGPDHPAFKEARDAAKASLAKFVSFSG